MRQASGVRPRTARFGAAALLLAVLLSGCYTVRPLPSPEPDPGTRVRAQLTQAGTAELAPLIGPQVVRVEGIVDQARPEAWQLFLISVEQADGQEVFWNREPILFPREAIANAHERQLDRTRSFLVAGGITAGAILLGRLVAQSASSGNGGGGPPVPVEFRGRP